MASSNDPKKCARASCKCVVSGDSDYCSTTCEGEGQSTDILCNCGHAGCREHN